MKYSKWLVPMLLVLNNFLSGCAPANSFAGDWTTNIGKVNFVQNGNTLTGTIEGYGGNWNESFQGTINGNEAAFSTGWFGDFTLVLDANTIKSQSADLAFCGVRSLITQELPNGCGFSGKWNLRPADVFPDGNYVLLKQAAENVTGDIYDAQDHIIDTITGKVTWGKGWYMDGNTPGRGPVSLNINAAETGFEVMFDPGNTQQVCAVRDGLQSAYLGYYTCEP